MGNFNGFVKLVVSGQSAVVGSFGALKRKVGVEFDHSVAGFDGVVGDLNLVVLLGATGDRERENRKRENGKPLSKPNIAILKIICKS